MVSAELWFDGAKPTNKPLVVWPEMGTSQAFAAQSGQCQPVPWWRARNATSLPWVRQLLSSLPWISVSKTVVCTRWKWRTERLSFEGEREIARTWRRRWCWTSAESPSWSCNLGCAESLDGIWMECADVTSTWPWSARGRCLGSSRYHSQYASASRMDHSPICELTTQPPDGVSPHGFPRQETQCTLSVTDGSRAG